VIPIFTRRITVPMVMVLVLTIVVLAGVYVWRLFHREWLTDEVAAKIQVGMSSKEVELILGMPIRDFAQGRRIVDNKPVSVRISHERNAEGKVDRKIEMRGREVCVLNFPDPSLPENIIDRVPGTFQRGYGENLLWIGRQRLLWIGLNHEQIVMSVHLFPITKRGGGIRARITAKLEEWNWIEKEPSGRDGSWVYHGLWPDR
jgi:hypothetical protein